MDIGNDGPWLGISKGSVCIHSHTISLVLVSSLAAHIVTALQSCRDATPLGRPHWPPTLLLAVREWIPGTEGQRTCECATMKEEQARSVY